MLGQIGPAFAEVDLRSTESRLAKLAGDGRVVYTASSATKPAWERVRYGHGVLTYFLFEALRLENREIFGGGDEGRTS